LPGINLSACILSKRLPLSGTVEIRNPTLRSQKRGQNIANYKREIPHPHVDLDLAEVKPSSLGHVNDCIYDKLLDATLSLCCAGEHCGRGLGMFWNAGQRF